jgi:hypothetical protein
VTAKGSYEQMAEARQRLLELLHYHQHRLEYRKRTEIAVEIVRQLEDEGSFPQVHYALDKGVLTLELTRLIESRGKQWVSEVSRHIQWEGHGRGVDEVGAELRQQHPESFRPESTSERYAFAAGKKTYGQKCRTIGREVLRSLLELSKRYFIEGKSCDEVLELLMPV